MSEFMIDRATFDDLKESVGADYIEQVVGAFSEEAPALVSQLRQAFVAGDLEIFRRAAHSIKSNAATFGATSLAALARELEFAARENRLVEVSDRLEILEEAVGCAIQELKALCL